MKTLLNGSFIVFMLLCSINSFMFGQKQTTNPATAGLLHSHDLEYLGAFRLPDVSTQSSWNYSGSASAFRADGDPSGPPDGLPGSIFAVGHDWYFDIAEISIPIPVISPLKDPEDLNTAGMLQPFTNVTNGFFDTIAYEIIRMGLAYLPAQGAQNSGKVYMCVGQHFQFELYYSHIWFDTDLGNPQTAGPWYFGNIDNYRTNDYMFTVPDGFANAHLGGKKLITGRYRDGGWGGKGPNVYTFAPWTEGNPPAPLAHLQNITHLIGYTDDDSLNGYKHADEWIGGAWLEHDSLSAVAILGTKALGNCWYGYANGVIFPNDSNYIPPWPYDIRGWWADDFEARILFYNPADLAAVAAGTMQPWEPQPYDSLNIENFLFNPFHDLGRDQIGSCSYDPVHGLLYVFERRADGDKCLVHVFRVNPPPATFLNLGNYSVGNGQNVCFAATQTITIAGNGTTFNILSGGSATFEAGTSILIKPDTYAQQGAHALFRIETGANFCGDQPALTSQQSLTESMKNTSRVDDAKTDPRLKIYPNPTTGLVWFHFQETDHAGIIEIQVINLQGTVIHHSTVTGANPYSVDFSCYHPGIYIVKISTNDHVDFVRIVRY